MGVRFLSALLLTTSFYLLLPPSAGANGYVDTVGMWQTVTSKSNELSQTLQELYAEIEVQMGAGHPQLKPAFAKRLAQLYPGSTSYGIGGVFAYNGYTKAYFDDAWHINRLTQQLGSVNKTYNFSEHSVEIASGSNRIKFQLDLGDPGRSRFVSAFIPAVAVSAETVWASKGANGPPSRALVDILNDSYAERFAVGDQLRMDQLAERLVIDQGLRQEVLDEASRIYARAPVRQEQSVKPIATDRPLARSALNPFRMVPWFIWVVFSVFIVAGLLLSFDKASRRVSRRGRVYEKRWRQGEQPPETEAKKGRAEKSAPGYTSRNTLHSEAEEAFLRVLEEVIDLKRYRINGKTRLADLIEVDAAPRTSQWHSAFNKIKSKHVDFVLYETAGSRLVGVIELDDSSHQLSERQQRDRLVDAALAQAGIPILHQPWSQNYDPEELVDVMRRTFGIEPPKHNMSF